MPIIFKAIRRIFEEIFDDIEDGQTLISKTVDPEVGAKLHGYKIDNIGHLNLNKDELAPVANVKLNDLSGADPRTVLKLGTDKKPKEETVKITEVDNDSGSLVGTDLEDVLINLQSQSTFNLSVPISQFDTTVTFTGEAGTIAENNGRIIAFESTFDKVTEDIVVVWNSIGMFLLNNDGTKIQPGQIKVGQTVLMYFKGTEMILIGAVDVIKGGSFYGDVGFGVAPDADWDGHSSDIRQDRLGHNGSRQLQKAAGKIFKAEGSNYRTEAANLDTASLLTQITMGTTESNIPGFAMYADDDDGMYYVAYATQVPNQKVFIATFDDIADTTPLWEVEVLSTPGFVVAFGEFHKDKDGTIVLFAHTEYPDITPTRLITSINQGQSWVATSFAAAIKVSAMSSEGLIVMQSLSPGAAVSTYLVDDLAGTPTLVARASTSVLGGTDYPVSASIDPDTGRTFLCVPDGVFYSDDNCISLSSLVDLTGDSVTPMYALSFGEKIFVQGGVKVYIVNTSGSVLKELPAYLDPNITNGKTIRDSLGRYTILNRNSQVSMDLYSIYLDYDNNGVTYSQDHQIQLTETSGYVRDIVLSGIVGGVIGSGGVTGSSQINIAGINMRVDKYIEDGGSQKESITRNATEIYISPEDDNVDSLVNFGDSVLGLSRNFIQLLRSNISGIIDNFAPLGSIYRSKNADGRLAIKNDGGVSSLLGHPDPMVNIFKFDDTLGSSGIDDGYIRLNDADIAVTPSIYLSHYDTLGVSTQNKLESFDTEMVVSISSIDQKTGVMFSCEGTTLDGVSTRITTDYISGWGPNGVIGFLPGELLFVRYTPRLAIVVGP